MSDAFAGRREDLRLITGRGCYTADWNLPGQVYGCFLRSDRAHAEIATLELGTALSSRGVLAVLTGEDVARAGAKTPRPITHFKGKNGSALNVPRRPALARDCVRFVGEPVALAIAESEMAAQDAAERIAVRYRDFGRDRCRRCGRGECTATPSRDPRQPGGRVRVWQSRGRRCGFFQAHRVVRATLRAQRIAGNPMEPKACLARDDPGSGIYDIYLSSQGASAIRDELAYITDAEPQRFRVHSRDVGGAFGVRNEIYPEFAAVCWPPGRSAGR